MFYCNWSVAYCTLVPYQIFSSAGQPNHNKLLLYIVIFKINQEILLVYYFFKHFSSVLETGFQILGVLKAFKKLQVGCQLGFRILIVLQTDESKQENK